MDITDIYPRLKIVPIDKCLAHEGIVQKWVDRIAYNILDHGVVKNPIIVSEHKGHYVVIDGMHRFSAFKKMELGHVLVCETDYNSKKIVLEGWDAFTFRRIGAKNLLCELFPEAEGYKIAECADVPEARKQLLKRKHLLVAGDKGGKFYTLDKPRIDNEHLLDELIHITEMIDAEIDARNLRVLYVENSLSDDKFENSDAASMILRPQFRKEEVIERTLQKQLFPRKSTRHLIPDRPLRVDLDLSLLRANINIDIKNRLLDEHLKWCFESDRVRYYPESVYIFAD
jgi:hypothetical protein